MSARRVSVFALAALACAPPAGGAVAAPSGLARVEASVERRSDASSTRPTARRWYPLIAAAGDIACQRRRPTENGDMCQQKAVSNLFRRWRPTRILTLGDNQYEDGKLSEFRGSFRFSWGRFRGRIRPSPGNHDYHTSGARGYYHYFGRRAGPTRRGYYSFNLGRWHLISLTSECEDVGGCREGSPQNRWLRRDLRRHRRFCTLAYWHHPRFSSGDHGNQEHVAPFWRVLWRYRADIVLSAHDHFYERFAPQTPSGRYSRRGIREWVVGTGGANHYPSKSPRRNSIVRNSNSFGALFLRLKPRGYTWQFLPAGDGHFRDRGRGRCH
jgi:hypothetical protein